MLKQFMLPFIGAFVIVTFALLMQFLWKYIDELVGKGLDLSVIAELLLYYSAVLAVMAFPLAMLLASILTMGNMGENYELIALKAAGISLQRIVFPLIVLSVFIAGCAFYFANNITPVATMRMQALIYDIRQKRPELQIQEGIFYNGIDGFTIRRGARNDKTNMLYDLMLYDHRKKAGNIDVTLADSGRMVVTADKRFLEVELFNGVSYVDGDMDVDAAKSRRPSQQNKNYPFQQRFFDRQVFRMVLPGYELERSSDDQIFKSGYQMLNLSQLTLTTDSLSTIIYTQEDQLRNIVQPIYSNPELKNLPVDTSHRRKIPDDFRIGFNQQTKLKRQSAIQEAVNSVRTQKDQVAGLIYELDNQNKKIWRYEIAWHQKITMPIACIIFFFIGAPLGAIIRKGGIGTPIIIAVIFFVLYYVISMIGEKSAREGAMTPFEGIWMSTFIIFAVGIFLTWMATRDSAIFNQEWYAIWFRKGLSFIFTTHRIPRREIAYVATLADLNPQNMIAKLEELSLYCKKYLEGDFRKHTRFREIWYLQEDAELKEIGKHYDDILTILKQSDVDMIRETVDEYPSVTLQYYKIKKNATWQAIAAALIFPVWIYLYLKVWIQKYSLRNELRNMMGANQNLVNELNSIL